MIGFTWTTQRLTGLRPHSRQPAASASKPTPVPVRSSPGIHLTFLVSLLFVGLTLCQCLLGTNLTLAIYVLSFWHYYLYGLAYCFGAIPLADFKRDAIVMKTVALAALAFVYLKYPLDFPSLALMASGFLLNALAARVLGADRTYYGYEVANLPPRRITAFPYSCISHPMLIGNVAAYGGTLLNADFRRAWWPLAVLHVAFNLALLLMEVFVTPQRRSVNPMTTREERYDSLATDVFILAASPLLVAATAFSHATGTQTLLTVGVLASAYAISLYRVYSCPQSLPDVHATAAQKDFS